MSLVVCADIGSTFTKVCAVDVASGVLVATAAHPTTVGTDVLDGLDSAVAGLGVPPGTPVLACSSAGGGLRLAVVGYEPLISAEAGRRVATSAGARVVRVAAGPLSGGEVAALRGAEPDVVLLVGGTDGGDADTVRHNAARLAAARIRVPVVYAGNAAAADDCVAVLAGRGVPVVACDNLLPRIGVLAPGPARAAIREMFLRHVIGGKKLSRGPRLGRLVRGATPDLVLAGVEVLADAGGVADLLLVDVGGATTDVYSVVTPDAERSSGPRRDVVGTLWRSRTVEGDLGVRWNAPGVVAAARAEKLLDDAAAAALDGPAAARAADPGLVARDGVDVILARLAATVAVRRHARGEPAAGGGPRRGGRDLGEVGLVVGSGGVLRHAAADTAGDVLAAVLSDHAGGWRVPRAATARIDTSYVIAAAGLLAADYPVAATGLLQSELYSG